MIERSEYSGGIDFAKTLNNMIEGINLKGVNFKKVAAVIVVLFIALQVRPFKVIEAGHRGVVLNFGAVSDLILDEGLHFIIPVYQSVREIDVRVRKSTTESDTASKDLQQVTTVIALNWHFAVESVNKVYQRVGTDVEDKIIDPAVQEATKAITAKYTAEQLITQRAIVSLEIKDILTKRLSKYDLVMDEFSIMDFSFSKSFNASIEAKQAAEQNALKAERDIARIRNEAESRVLKARSEATEIRLKSQQLTPLMIQKEWIEKWDGALPKFVAGDKASFLMNMND